MRKILSFILSFGIVCTMLVVPDITASAALGIDKEFEVSLLAALDIVPGYPDNYKANEAVDAKTFLTDAYKMGGITNIDVDTAMRKYGIVDDTKVSTITALKVIFDVIDYDEVVKVNKYDYNRVVSTYGLFNGTNVKFDSKSITYEQMVMLFYNALNLKALNQEDKGLVEKDKTVMEYYLNVYEGKGILTANADTAIDGGILTSKSEVRIGTDTYAQCNTYSSHLLGCHVKFYYYESDRGDDGAIIKWIDTSKQNTILTVYGCDVNSYTENTVRYESGNHERSLKLDKNTLFVYNGKVVLDGTVTMDNLKSETAKIDFIDNNGNGAYDIMNIMDYQYYYVDAIGGDKKTVNDYKAKTSIDLDGDNIDNLYIYKDGRAVDISQVTEGSVIAVALSNDEKCATVHIITGSISGEITSLSSNKATISGTAYYISPAYAGDELKTDKEGIFYFDMLGKLVRSDGLKLNTSKYGYLLFYGYATNEEGPYYAHILTADNTVEYFEANKKVVTNGGTYAPADLMTYLGGRPVERRLVTYKVNGDNKLTSLYLADENYIGIDEDKSFFSLHFKGAGKYRKNNMCFNSKYLIDASTPIFVIPYSGEKDDYKVIDASALVNNQTYDMWVYDIDEYMSAGCIVMNENFIEPENLRTKRSIIITDTYSEYDKEEGEPKVVIEGYQQGSKVKYRLFNNDLKDNRGNYLVRNLSEGDVIQVGVNADNEVNVVQLLFKANEGRMPITNGSDTPNKYWEGGSAIMPDLYLSYGIVADRSTSVILLDTDGNDSVVTKEPHKIGNQTTVYVYENGAVRTGSKTDITRYSHVYAQEYQGNLQEVIIVKE